MNFFKSLLLDEDESSSSDLEHDDDENSIPESPSKPLEEEEESVQEPEEEEEDEAPETDFEENDEENDDTSVWSFGGLMKTFATKSESVIQTYRKDLEDFSSGLKKETAVIREAASRVVKDLPEKFEVGASVAQESLESVGQAIDDIGSTVWKGTADIISHGKESLRSVDLDGDGGGGGGDTSFENQQMRTNPTVGSKRYSRFEAQIYAIQTDLNTYCEDPEDFDDFSKWKSGFVLEEKGEEIENLFDENEVMEGVYSRVVPRDVDHDTFWVRYFYRVYKLKQIEDARANLVKRAISGEEEEDLSWDIDDDEEVEDINSSPKELEKKVTEIGEKSESPKELEKELEKKVTEMGEKSESNREIDNESSIAESTSGNGFDANEVLEGNVDLSELKGENLEVKTDENLMAESSKDSDVSVVSSQPSLPEEEDLSWDEIEDMGSGDDEKKVAVDGSLNRASLDKRRIVVDEEDEDLSWDIEDDEDEPVKS